MTRCFRVFAVCAFALGLSQAADATQVGTAVVGGRIVILEDNNTWRYADAPDQQAPATCDRFTGIELCIKGSGWISVPRSGVFQAIYANSGRYYLGLIQEPFGSKSGVSPEGLQDIIISNVAMLSNVDVSAIPILGASASVPQAAGARSVSFTAKTSGVTFVYHNIFKVRDDDALQLVFWSIGTELKPDFTAKIDEAMAKIKID